MAKNKLFRRLHRRVGIASMLFLALLAVTGIILNHAQEWRLYDKRLPSSVASIFYPELAATTVFQYQFEELNLYQIEQAIYLEQDQLALSCSAEISGAALVGSSLWVSCGNSLSLFQSDGVLVEKLTLAVDGISALARCQQALCVLQQDDWYLFDEASLQLDKVEGAQNYAVEKPQTTQLDASAFGYTPAELNVGRLISDIHSGAIAGAVGKLFVDLIGIIILFLSLTGLYLWVIKKRSES